MAFYGAYNDVLRAYNGILELELHELKLHAIFFFFI